MRGPGDPGRPQGSLLPWTTGCELGDHKNRATAREPDDHRMRAGRPQGSPLPWTTTGCEPDDRMQIALLLLPHSLVETS